MPNQEELYYGKPVVNINHRLYSEHAIYHLDELEAEVRSATKWFKVIFAPAATEKRLLEVRQEITQSRHGRLFDANYEATETFVGEEGEVLSALRRGINRARFVGDMWGTVKWIVASWLGTVLVLSNWDQAWTTLRGWVG